MRMPHLHIIAELALLVVVLHVDGGYPAGLIPACEHGTHAWKVRGQLVAYTKLPM